MTVRRRFLPLALLAATATAVAAVGCDDATTGRPPAGPPPQTAAPPKGATVLPPPQTPLQTTSDLDTVAPYETITQGTGAPVKVGDVVLMHYTASLASSGVEYDSTRRLGQPFVLTVGAGHVIRGWDLLLPKLHVGDHVKTTIPSRLAYGAAGLTGVIPADADLAFDIEIVGIVPSPSWEVVTKGEGNAAIRGSKATVHYIGTLPDGTVFDDSRARNEPFSFRVGAGEVIEGWDWIVSRMRGGDRWKVVIPWAFAYGAEGSPPTVPAMTDLHFDIEVLRVE
ncbi:MAG: FKBP-type peptidyl-prolyl cis-trans isomerase [Planctomycetes bacterium]|nr:FKBP-type peptidyl-prolyl cis-trans isomerase [Planctomycetota bacterium]